MQQLSVATVALAAFLAEQEAGIDALRRGKVAEALIYFKELRDGYEKLDEPRKQLNALIERLSREAIPGMFEEEDIKTTTIESDRIGKFRFTVSQKVSCSMIDKELAMNWLRSEGHGGIIQETIPAPTLAAFAKAFPEQNPGKDMPETLFKISTLNYTSVTKA